MKKLLGIFLVILVVSVFVFGSCAAPVSTPPPSPSVPAPGSTPLSVQPSTPTQTPKAKQIEWKAISMFKVDDPTSWQIKELVERINKRSNGELFIDFLGGPEVIPYDDQTAALMNGVVDLAFNNPVNVAKPTGVKELQAFGMYDNFKISPMDLRERGVYVLLNELLETSNLMWIGSSMTKSGHFLASNKKVETLEDFKGMKIRSWPAIVDLVQGLGAVPVSMPPGDAYTALERGTVDAAGTSHPAWISLHWYEVVKYGITDTVATRAGGNFVNLSSWNKLPENLRTLILDTQIEMEKVDIPKYCTEEVDQVINTLKENGMEFIDIKPLGALTEFAFKIHWDKLAGDCPEYGPQLKEMLTP
ncbi:TRAP transporter substrate-binding protein [Chloroflexota bacterium]